MNTILSKSPKFPMSSISIPSSSSVTAVSQFFEFEKWRAIRASVGGVHVWWHASVGDVGGMLAWVTWVACLRR